MLLIKSGKLITPFDDNIRICDILIQNGVVTKIADKIENESRAEIIDATGLYVAPGLVDVHVHFREPGFTYKEDIMSGSNAAKKGGFTTVVMMANTKPAIDSEKVLGDVLELAKKADINVLSSAAVSKNLSGRELTDMKKLKSLGARAFTDDGIAITDAAFLQKAMIASKELDAVICLHEEDPGLIINAGINGCGVAKELGIGGAPAVSEYSMIARDCMLALHTGAKIHIQHVSAKESVELIRFAKQMGADISAEITPQHFSLTDAAVLAKGTLAKLNPPLRGEDDRQALIDGLKRGDIEMIASDHAPHSDEEKQRPLAEAPSGMTGLETALALGITNLVKTGALNIPQLIGRMTKAPAARFGLDAGAIEVNLKADIVIFDEDESFAVGDFASKASNSPFAGETLFGKVKYTICNGKLVYSDKD